MKSVLERGLGRCFAPKAHGDFLGSGISATAFLIELLAERNTPKGVILMSMIELATACQAKHFYLRFLDLN